MSHRIDIEIGRKSMEGAYGCGLYSHIDVENNITLEKLLNQAETQAREICLKRNEEFVECMIREIH